MNVKFEHWVEIPLRFLGSSNKIASSVVRVIEEQVVIATKLCQQSILI